MKYKIAFPPIENADKHGLLCVGGDLTVSNLLEAYTHGIFPWPIEENLPMTWFAPDPRGVLFFDQLRVSRSLQKVLNKNIFTVTFNMDFDFVIEACSQNPYRGDDTWITPELIAAYRELFHAGHAFSVETRLDGQVVGGLYGVCIGEFFAGESMFYLESNASKVALYSLVKHLKSRGVRWMDTQMQTPVTEAMGVCNISRKDYMLLLEQVDFSKSRSSFF